MKNCNFMCCRLGAGINPPRRASAGPTKSPSRLASATKGDDGFSGLGGFGRIFPCRNSGPRGLAGIGPASDRSVFETATATASPLGRQWLLIIWDWPPTRTLVVPLGLPLLFQTITSISTGLTEFIPALGQIRPIRSIR